MKRDCFHTAFLQMPSLLEGSIGVSARGVRRHSQDSSKNACHTHNTDATIGEIIAQNREHMHVLKCSPLYM